MNIFELILLLGLLLLPFSIYMLFRNELVAQEKMRVLKIVSERAKEVIAKGGEKKWEDEYKPYDKYSYDYMMLHFWVPVSSFYKDIK